VTRTRITAAGIEGSVIVSQGLAVRTAVSLRRTEGGRRNTRKQSADNVRTREVEEEIGIQGTIRDPGAVTRGTETRDVIVPAQADHTLRIAREEKLDLHPERSHGVPPAVRSRINQKSTQRKAKS